MIDKIDRCNYIQQQVNDLGIMSLWQDTASAMEIIKLYDSAEEMNMIEFGAGNASWPILVTGICTLQPKINAWESFQHVHYDFSIPTDSYYRNLARNKEELNTLISSKISNHKIEVIDRYVNCSYDILDSDENSYDIIRLDCLESYAEINKLLEYVVRVLKPGGLFFIDDINPIICINRFRAAMNYDDTGELSLLWTGIKECAFQKPGGVLLNQEQLKNKLFDHYGFESVITNTEQSTPTKTYLRHCT
jgi:ubiquinone/menaquinone biosynthesis C-methylase UbiE